jgi:hypothetical protein
MRMIINDKETKTFINPLNTLILIDSEKYISKVSEPFIDN